MKKIIIVLVAIIAFYSTSNAQAPPCPDDCPGVPWLGPFTFTCNVCNGVTATCEFEMRCNTCKNPAMPEFRINGDININGPYSPLCTMEIIIKELSKQIIKQKLGLITPCGPEDNLPVNFFTASCWKWDGLLQQGHPLPPMKPCYGTGCCLSHYQAIKQIDNSYEVKYLNSRPYGPNTCDPNDPSCHYICE